jgi:DNA-binding NarL/FixJ family response regulator
VRNILRKLKVNDRTAAAVWALRNRIPTITFLPADLK